MANHQWGLKILKDDKTRVWLLYLFTVLISNFTVFGQTKDLQYYFHEGYKACQDGRYEDCLNNFTTANRLRPNHQIIMYHLARAHSFNSNVDSSHFYLRKSLAIKADWDLSDSAYTSWSSSSQFTELLSFQQDLMSPIKLSKPLVRLSDRRLHIESVAYDPLYNHLYLGSVHKQKIIKVDLNNSEVFDFKDTGAHGLWSIFGMKIDSTRRHLWLCSVATDLMIHADSTIEGSAAVYKFDLNSGEPINRYTLDDSLDHWFGDLTLSRNGTIYISDSQTSTIYSIHSDDDALTTFFHSDKFRSLQGLDLSEDGRFLFVADYVTGLYRLDLSNKQLVRLSNQLKEVSLKSVDGLYVYKNSLVTTQNQVIPMRVTQYFLDRDLDAIVDHKYLENG